MDCKRRRGGRAVGQQGSREMVASHVARLHSQGQRHVYRTRADDEVRRGLVVEGH